MPLWDKRSRLDDLGLKAGQYYNFDLFFAERHVVDSHFRIDTSIPLTSNLTSNPVPEPASMLLFSLGLLGFYFKNRKFSLVVA